MPLDRRRPAYRATAALAAAVVLCVLTVSCDNSENPPRTDGDKSTSLTLPGELTPGTAGLPAPTTDAPISVGVGTVVCLSGPGVATIVAVRPVGATENFELEDFAVRPNPSLTGGLQLGGEPGTLQDVGFEPGELQVDAVCDDAGSGYEVAVQLARTGSGPGISHGFDIDWESGTKSGSLHIPLSVVLCDADTAQIPRCRQVAA